MQMLTWVTYSMLDLQSKNYNMNTKKQKTNDLSKTNLWDCRLGHISVRRNEEIPKSWNLKVNWFWLIWNIRVMFYGQDDNVLFAGMSERATKLEKVTDTLLHLLMIYGRYE